MPTTFTAHPPQTFNFGPLDPDARRELRRFYKARHPELMPQDRNAAAAAKRRKAEEAAQTKPRAIPSPAKEYESAPPAPDNLGCFTGRARWH